MAECDPKMKLDLAIILRDLGQVTCFSGDSIGDCIAMSEANISMTMQDSGTDVAKKTCDLVLKDFELILDAIKLGRNIDESMRKFI